MTNQWTRWAAWFLAICLVACGGGGGDQEGSEPGGNTPTIPTNPAPPASPEPQQPAPEPNEKAWFSFSPATLTARVQPGDRLVLSARSDKTIAEPLNIAIVDAGGVFDPAGTQIVESGPLNYQITLRIAAQLPAKLHVGNLAVRLCRDEMHTCQRPYPGADWKLPYRIELPGEVIAPASVHLGGETGRDLAPVPLTLSLNTGADAHAWTLTGVPDWLTVSATGGMVSQAGTTVLLTAQPTTGGQRSADMQITASINGTVVTRTVRVDARTDTRKLLFADTGVALASTSRWSRLERTIGIRDNFGADIGWRAQANQTWLQVTPAGRTDAQGHGTLSLRAHAAGLPDGLHIAHVVLTPEHPATVAPEKLVVGFWKSSSNLPRTTRVALRDQHGYAPSLVTDPVRPYAYVAGETGIEVIHVHSGRSLGLLTAEPVRAVHLAISTDGSQLYVGDNWRQTIMVIDIATARIVQRHAVPAGMEMYPLHYMRPNGVGLLLVGGVVPMRVDNGQFLDSPMRYDRRNTAATSTRDGRRLVLSGTSYELPELWDTDVNDLHPGKLLASLRDGGAANTPASYYGWLVMHDAAITADGNTLATISNALGIAQCVVVDLRQGVRPSHVIDGTADARSVAIGSDGRVRCVARPDSRVEAPSVLRIAGIDGSLSSSHALPDQGGSPLDAVGLFTPSGDALVEVGRGYGNIVLVPSPP